MARRLRKDHPGSWHHVFARGMARRTVFEHRRDIRVFTCRLALECRRGALEVHALCFMTNHLHLLDLLHLVAYVDDNPIAARMAPLRGTYVVRALPKLTAHGAA